MVIGIECTGNCKSNYHTIPTTTAPSGTGSDVYITIYCTFFLHIRHIYHYVLLDLLRMDQQLDYKIHIYLSLHICRRLNKCYLGMCSHQLVGLDNSGRPLVYHTCLYMRLMFCRRNHHYMPMLEGTKKTPNKSNYFQLLSCYYLTNCQSI